MALMLLGTTSALAQSASQITPPSAEPSLQKPGSGISSTTGTWQQPPAGADTLNIRVDDVVFEGALPALAEEQARIKAELVGKTVRASELFAAAGRLERAYQRRGYGLVRVALPPQHLVDGATLRMLVVDGFIERVDTTHVPANIRDQIDTVLAPLVGQRGISMGLIERQVLLAGDLPGTVLRSTLSAGSTLGASILTIEARYKPVTGSMSLDNRLSDNLGKYTLGVGLDLNSLFGQGEQIYLRASGVASMNGDSGFFADQPRNRSLVTGVILPLGRDGLALNVEAVISRTAPMPQSGYQFHSDFSRYSARLSYPLVRSRSFTLNATGAIDAQEETLRLNDFETAISQDRLRVLRPAVDMLWYAGDAIVTAGIGASWGLNVLGARTASAAAATDTPLSRQGADASFHKLELNANYRQPLTRNLTIDLRARGQTSFGQPLLNAEQFGAATPSGLSAFDSGVMQGDSGFVVRGELQFPSVSSIALPFALPAWPAQQGTGLPEGNSRGAMVVSPYLFGAYGGVRLFQPTVLESAWTRAISYGVGLRLGAAEQAGFNATNLSIEFGRAQRLGGAGSNRVSFLASLQF